jgi:hypothetical protein
MLPIVRRAPATKEGRKEAAWSVTRQGVDRHEDPMLQNCGSQTPPNGLTPMARVEAAKAENPTKPCCPGSGGKGGPYKRSSWIKQSSTDKQKALANKGTPPPPQCWECGSTSPRGWRKAPPPAPGVRNAPQGKSFVADHDPPLIVRHYAGGCWMSKADKKKDAESLTGIVTHCTKCSSKQGNALGSKGHHPVLKAAHGCK